VNLNPNPFQYIRLVRNVLTAFAFVTACCTVIWLRLLPGSFQWNNRTVGVLSLSLLAIVALLMVYTLNKKDRPKTVICIVVFLGACITIIVLAVQDYLQRETKRLNDPAATFAPPESGQSVEMNSGEPGQAVTNNSENPRRGGSRQAIGSLSETDLAVNGSRPNLPAGAEPEARLWIVPDIWTSGSRQQTNPPTGIVAEGEPWVVTTYHLDNSHGSHEWFVDSPWRISTTGGAYSTNASGPFPAKTIVWAGTLYPAHATTRTFPIMLFRIPTGGSNTSAAVSSPETKPTPTMTANDSHLAVSRFNLSVPHSAWDFVRAFQTTND
jgi:hypothetical protein